ncbi:hypothetical protein [Beggiatoa leptomitoformis]|uniref:Uncharacterized protein n=1 Tax=Beggiatoa leptomitoformis TaxID=288004 RepID=A0A2N9YCC8_9GAMM|nr:hypothetical protein [Beggiatoa leptomitoformis]ALG66571.1 hypothetical protein AL038_00980 [Beggiatoa leptomitoformis]AUI68127.1 hypothetical protein BLE401_05060 [Beggiatoa leptomitoformis]
MYFSNILVLFTLVSLIPVGYAEEQTGKLHPNNAQDETAPKLQLRPRPRSNSELPPTVWAINVYESGDFCYISQENVSLWRSDASEPLKVTIQQYDTASQSEVMLRWPTNQTMLTWPQKKLPLSENLSYMIQVNDIGRIVNTHRLPSNLATASNTDKAKWMQTQGCTRQADMLTNTTKMGAS